MSYYRPTAVKRCTYLKCLVYYRVLKTSRAVVCRRIILNDNPVTGFRRLRGQAPRRVVRFNRIFRFETETVTNYSRGHARRGNVGNNRAKTRGGARDSRAKRGQITRYIIISITTSRDRYTHQCVKNVGNETVLCV